MKRVFDHLPHGVLIIVLVLSVFSGCTPWERLVFQGGSLVEPSYQPTKIVVSYRATGAIPEAAKYYLIETREGEEAIWEKVDGEKSALFKAYRETDKGDHYSGWVVGQPASEFIVPKDRSRDAEKYVYPVGKYKALKGSMAVVPLEEFEPVAILIPE